MIFSGHQYLWLCKLDKSDLSSYTSIEAELKHGESNTGYFKNRTTLSLGGNNGGANQVLGASEARSELAPERSRDTALWPQVSAQHI